MFEVGLAEAPELLLVVVVDGWAKIMNAHPKFDGIAFEESQDLIGEVPSWIECTIFRKDRKVALTIKEYFAEARNDQMVWITHPRRMLRHKALVQCARFSFGLAGIYEPDEVMRIRQSKRQTDRFNGVSGKEESDGCRWRLRQALPGQVHSALQPKGVGWMGEQLVEGLFQCEEQTPCDFLGVQASAWVPNISI